MSIAGGMGSGDACASSCTAGPHACSLLYLPAVDPPVAQGNNHSSHHECWLDSESVEWSSVVVGFYGSDEACYLKSRYGLRVAIVDHMRSLAACVYCDRGTYIHTYRYIPIDTYL